MIIQADLHTHTLASTHAYSTLVENCKIAKEYGLRAIAMTDHAMQIEDSPHVWHFENLKVLPRKIEDVIVLKGAEVNILDDEGSVDLPEHLLKRLEWIVASMHNVTYNATTPENHTKAYLAIAENQYVDVIGHCTNLTFPFDMETAVKKFKEYEKYVEINQNALTYNKGSRVNGVELMKLCKKYEVPVVLDSDSHFCYLIGQVPVGEQLVEELSFPKSLIANSDWNTIREHIIKKRGDIGL